MCIISQQILISWLMLWDVSPALGENAHIQTWPLGKGKASSRQAPLGSYSINGAFFFIKDFGLTMTLRARFYKWVTTTTNHRALRVHVQKQEETCVTHFPILSATVEYKGQVALSLEMKDRFIWQLLPKRQVCLFGRGRNHWAALPGTD